MAAVTIRNLPEQTLRALKYRAKSHGRSTEAEIREILQEAAHPPNRIKVGSELAAFAKKFKDMHLKIVRDQEAVEPAEFE
jgi:plasmid stability protein